MKQLQETVSKLSELRNHYASYINNANNWTVHPKDIQSFNTLISNLISQVLPYSPCIANTSSRNSIIQLHQGND